MSLSYLPLTRLLSQALVLHPSFFFPSCWYLVGFHSSLPCGRSLRLFPRPAARTIWGVCIFSDPGQVVTGAETGPRLSNQGQSKAGGGQASPRRVRVGKEPRHGVCEQNKGTTQEKLSGPYSNLSNISRKKDF